MLIDLRRERFSRAAGTILLATLCAAPFLAVQLQFDRAVTGQWLKTPVQAYYDRYWPGVVFGLHPHVLPGEHRPADWLPQFRDDYDRFVLKHFTGDRTNPRPARQILQWGLPQSVMLVLLPVGLLASVRRRAWVLAAGLLLMPILYATWVMYLPEYAAVATPALAIVIGLGAAELIRAFPADAPRLRSAVALGLLLLCAISLPEISGRDKTVASPAIARFNRQSSSIHAPAVVFFTYPTDDPMAWKHEQTYNLDSANIDDQPIIRAQDLGAKNRELIDYYKRLQPARRFYRFDQKTGALVSLEN